jgi:hypothetical protein
MGINEIHDGRDSLLTQRLESLRKVQKREGEAGGGQRFQQIFEFAESNEEREKEKDKEQEKNNAAPVVSEAAPPPVIPNRALTAEEIEKVRKRNELKPGQLIDVEA